MNKRIFIADDDESIVDAVSMILQIMGYDVDFTYDGAKVIEGAKKKPDLILLDIWMSGHDGRDICKILKGDKKYKDIPILMISASRDIEKSALEAGANGFIEKPFEMESLLNKVTSLIN